MPELVQDVMKTMAGFSKHEQWYVGRCYADMPTVDYIKFLFPNIDKWKKEMNGKFGDKHAYNMLYGLLPYLAGVAVQDGIYWLRDFPNHEVSVYLKAQIPEYEQWARRMLPVVAEKTANRHQAEINSLNAAATAAFEETV
jgi:hypothetical protein